MGKMEYSVGLLIHNVITGTSLFTKKKNSWYVLKCLFYNRVPISQISNENKIY